MLSKPYRALPGLFLVLVLLLTSLACKPPTVTGNLPAAGPEPVPVPAPPSLAPAPEPAILASAPNVPTVPDPPAPAAAAPGT